MNSKYAPFEDFLSAYNGDALRIAFRKIEKIIGSKLPNISYNHDVWLANTIYQCFMKIILKSGWKQRKVEMFIEFQKNYNPKIMKKRRSQNLVSNI